MYTYELVHYTVRKTTKYLIVRARVNSNIVTRTVMAEATSEWAANMILNDLALSDAVKLTDAYRESQILPGGEATPAMYGSKAA